MKPLNLFDAVAVPMYDVFTPNPDNDEPYEAIVPNVNLTERNTEASPNARVLEAAAARLHRPHAAALPGQDPVAVRARRGFGAAAARPERLRARRGALAALGRPLEGGGARGGACALGSSAGEERINRLPRSERQRSECGSTGRKVRDRHRLGPRHRPRDGRAAGRAGRTGPDQRPRRRRRRGGRRPDQGRDRGLLRRPHQGGRLRQADRDGGRRLREDRHHRQQRGLHLGRPDPQDVRRAVPGDDRHPQRRAVPRPARGRSAPARAGEAGEGRGQGGVPQDREHLLDLGHDGQRGPGELLVRQGRRRRPDEDAREGVGPVQDQRERGRVRVRRDAPDRLQGGGRHDREGRPGDQARHPRADARDGRDDHPARTARHARGGGRPGVLPLHARGPTTSTARSST